jgi:predicted transcriptional regulator
VEGGINAVQHEYFANRVEYEDIIAVVGGANTVVLVPVALVVETKIVRLVLGGLL